VVAGRLNKQVADELAISEITVKVHRGNMMRKMKARSVPDLVKMVAKLDLDGPSTSGDSLPATSTSQREFGLTTVVSRTRAQRQKCRRI
jgi:hypothetical protein